MEAKSVINQPEPSWIRQLCWDLPPHTEGRSLQGRRAVVICTPAHLHWPGQLQIVGTVLVCIHMS